MRQYPLRPNGRMYGRTLCSPFLYPMKKGRTQMFAPTITQILWKDTCRSLFIQNISDCCRHRGVCSRSRVQSPYAHFCERDEAELIALLHPTQCMYLFTTVFQRTVPGFLFTIVYFQFVIKCSAADAEYSGCLGAVAVGFFESLSDGGSFCLFHCFFEG